MNLNFTNDTYKTKAMNINNTNTHSHIDAFFLLIKDLKQEDLDNLCIKIQNFYNNEPYNLKLNLQDCYRLTQNTNLNNEMKTIIFNLALECLNSNIHLGTNTILDGKINTSSWISHALNVGIVARTLAHGLDLDEDKAMTYGLLHDYGRKFTHTFDHAIVGFEKLTDLGWNNEAIGCLTHSFVNGGRCANNEPAIEGFYIDENGKPQWKNNTKKDDITIFLENYQYSEYDKLLNIADLMATDKKITSPFDRIQDIATRRQIDPKNRTYFLTEFTNMLIKYLEKLNINIKTIEFSKEISIDDIESIFKDVSDIFYKNFKELNQKKNKTIS